MPTLEWRPTKKQSEFISIPDSVNEALGGGSAGGGKSELLLLLPLVRGFHTHPRFKGIIFRRTYPELEREMIIRSHEYYGLGGAGAKYSDQKKRWVFPEGGVLQFGYAEHEKDVRNYDTTEYNYMAFDELTSFTEFQYMYLAMSRVRSSADNLPAIVRAGTNPGNVGHCVPYGEVLTPSGWIDIKDLKVGDPVYEVDPDLNLINSIVEQAHEHDFEGQLWNCESSNLSISCTPEHRIFRKKQPLGWNILTPANQLPGQAHIVRAIESTTGESPDLFSVAKSFNIDETSGKHEQPTTLNYGDYAELMGWYLSEGFVLSRGEQLKERYFGIAQSKEGNRILIINVLENCGFKYRFDENQFHIYSPHWFEYFRQFGQSRDKFIPRHLLNASKLDQRILFTALMRGDGNWRNENSGIYYTISKQLADDVAELAFKLGYRVKINSRQREKRSGLSYEIAFDSNKITEVLTGQHKYKVNTEVKRPKNIYDKGFKGKVYCIGVPKHNTFVIKQNGSIWISGNSFVRKRFVEPHPKGNVILKETRTRDGHSATLYRIFIPFLAQDNEYLMKNDPGYLDRLANLPDAERAAKLYGDWWTFEGQVFDDFRIQPFPDEPPNACHVCKEFRIPDYWPRILSVDWGYSAQTAAGWYAIDPGSGRIYKYREYSAKRTNVSTWAADLARLSQGEEITDAVLDPSAWGHRGDEFTLSEQIVQASGIPFRRADNDRIGGKILLQEYLRWKPKPPKYIPPEGYDHEVSLRILRIQGPQAHAEYTNLFIPEVLEQNLPKFQIFESCTETIKVIPLCVYKKPTAAQTQGNKEDVQEFDGDDFYDETRYGLKACQFYLDGGVEEFKKQSEIAKACAVVQAGGDVNTFYRRMDRIERLAEKSERPVVFAGHGKLRRMNR